MNEQTMTSTSDISEAFDLLAGKKAWGLRRSHGSMFFLEIGDPVVSDGQKHVHGEWHFLFELCHWRIQSQANVIIGSEDSQDFIDRTFSSLSLGDVKQASLNNCSDLELTFTSGCTLRTFSTSASTEADWTQWLFFTPGDIAWKKAAFGVVTRSDIHQA
jgi:hypothetical protein